jgi:hypothetical protein
MKTFSDKTKTQVYEAQNGYCKGCLNKIHSYHHKLPNNKANRRKFPLFIHSPFNGVGLCLDCHTNKDHLYTITEQEAEGYERFLQELYDYYKGEVEKLDV